MGESYCDLGKNMKSLFDKQVNNCVGAIVYVLENVIGGDDWWEPTIPRALTS